VSRRARLWAGTAAHIRAGTLAAAILLAGCTPAQWPARDEPPAGTGKPVPGQPQARTPGGATGPTGAKPPTGAGNPPFYEVFGERYFVLPSSEGYREQGVASWYGKPFHGRRTSSGAVYDMYELTAAHKTLPLPSLVRVTNLDSGRSVIVTVNDRGPFVKDRIIDLSFAAARQLDIVNSGTGRVEVEAVSGRSGAVPVVVESVAPTGNAAGDTAVAPTMVPVQHLFMQVGAFGTEANAVRLKTQLEASGVNDVVIRYDATVSPALYRVRIGPIDGSAEYDALASRLASLRIANPRLVTESPVTLPAR
jgi:rare lipoprotein A